MDAFKRKAVETVADQLFADFGLDKELSGWNIALSIVNDLEAKGLLLTGETVMNIQLSTLETVRS